MGNGNLAFRVAVVYLIVGALWIVFSDRLLAVLAPEPASFARLQTFKGWGFVLVSALVLYFYIAFEAAQVRRAREEQQRSASDFRQLLDSSLDAILITSPEGDILAANAAACRLFGRSEAELIRLGRGAVVDAGDPRLAIALQQPQQTGHFLGELTFRRSDGSSFEGQVASFVYETAAGQPRTLMIIHDLSTRRRVEAEARDAQALWQTVFAAANDAILVLDGETRIRFHNQAAHELYGCSLVGMCVSDLREDSAQAQAEIAELINSGGGRWETQHRRLDGSCFPVEVSVRSFEWGGQRHFVQIVRDITQRKQAEAEIQQLNAELEQRVLDRTAELSEANRELEAFTYSVSHDLRAPLRAINGFAAIIARRHRAALDEQGRHYFDNILLASERMGRLIDDLLTYSRLGRSGLQRQRLSLQEILDELQQELQPRLEEIGGQLQIVGKLPEVWGDRTLLTQLFSNLLENALLYRRKDVPLRVQVDCPEQRGRVIVRVQDNGIGIPPEYHEKIFNIFQRLHSEDEIPGTGIGLATVRKAAALHGGTVWVESTPGEGSTFWVKLPQGADQ